MGTYLKKIAMQLTVIAFFAVLTVIFMPHSTFALAGNGGGGSGGCKGSNFCTDYGAVWRYRTTNGDTTIPGLYGTTVAVTGCGPYGGFFEYVLVGINGNGDVRSWEIGRTNSKNNSNTYRSVYFGGATAYRPSSDGGTLPAILSNNTDYSWPAVNTAFNDMPSPQRNGYNWDGNSRLGWFCYRNANYNLVPTITTNPSNAVTSGSQVAVNGAVTNNGATSSATATWQISQFNVPSGAAIPAGGDSSAPPTAFYGNGATTAGSGSGTFPVSSTNLSTLNITVPDAPVGTRVCFALSVSPYNQSTSDWRHSAPTCVVISKRPVVQVIGGDLRVGAAFTGDPTPAASVIQTSVTIKAGTSYGSWDEYGLTASGAITGMASGSAFAGGLLCTLNCPVTELSFANESIPIGRYTALTPIPDIGSAFALTSMTPLYSGLGDAALKRVETSKNDITIPGGTIQKNQWLVINAPTATVTITGDITYNELAPDGKPMTSIGQIPQLVIIANKINIEGNVKNVDAWLIASGATGTIDTCSAWGGAQLDPTTVALTNGICTNALLVNGPVMAKKLYLMRTYGNDSGPLQGMPAETFNLRPDAYLWGIAYTENSGRLTTVYETELPPRF